MHQYSATLRRLSASHASRLPLADRVRFAQRMDAATNGTKSVGAQAANPGLNKNLANPGGRGGLGITQTQNAADLVMDEIPLHNGPPKPPPRANTAFVKGTAPRRAMFSNNARPAGWMADAEGSLAVGARTGGSFLSRAGRAISRNPKAAIGVGIGAAAAAGAAAYTNYRSNKRKRDEGHQYAGGADTNPGSQYAGTANNQYESERIALKDKLAKYNVIGSASLKGVGLLRQIAEDPAQFYALAGRARGIGRSIAATFAEENPGTITEEDLRNLSEMRATEEANARRNLQTIGDIAKHEQYADAHRKAQGQSGALPSLESPQAPPKKRPKKGKALVKPPPSVVTNANDVPQTSQYGIDMCGPSDKQPVDSQQYAGPDLATLWNHLKTGYKGLKNAYDIGSLAYRLGGGEFLPGVSSKAGPAAAIAASAGMSAASSGLSTGMSAAATGVSMAARAATGIASATGGAISGVYNSLNEPSSARAIREGVDPTNDMRWANYLNQEGVHDSMREQRIRPRTTTTSTSVSSVSDAVSPNPPPAGVVDSAGDPAASAAGRAPAPESSAGLGGEGAGGGVAEQYPGASTSTNAGTTSGGGGPPPNRAARPNQPPPGGPSPSPPIPGNAGGGGGGGGGDRGGGPPDNGPPGAPNSKQMGGSGRKPVSTTGEVPPPYPDPDDESVTEGEYQSDQLKDVHPDTNRTNPITPATGSRQTPATANSIQGVKDLRSMAEWKSKKLGPASVHGTAAERANMGKGALDSYEFNGPYDYPIYPGGRPDESLTLMGAWRTRGGHHSSLWYSKKTAKGGDAKRNKYFKWSEKGGGNWRKMGKDTMVNVFQKPGRWEGDNWFNVTPGQKFAQFQHAHLRAKEKDIQMGRIGNMIQNERKESGRAGVPVQVPGGSVDMSQHL